MLKKYDIINIVNIFKMDFFVVLTDVPSLCAFCGMYVQFCTCIVGTMNTWIHMYCIWTVQTLSSTFNNVLSWRDNNVWMYYGRYICMERWLEFSCPILQQSCIQNMYLYCTIAAYLTNSCIKSVYYTSTLKNIRCIWYIVIWTNEIEYNDKQLQ